MSVFSITEVWDSVLYQIYNIFSVAKFLFSSRKLKKAIRTNKKLKNKHLGERCFILLNGPSLNDHDLSFLSNEYVFVTNYFFRSALCKVVNPNYYCWVDSKLFGMNSCRDTIEGIQKECPEAELFLNYKGFQKFGSYERCHFTLNKLLPNNFSMADNLAKPCASYSTVALYAINVALFLGFKKIFILGLDFEPGAFKHFADLNSKCDDPTKKSNKEDICGNYWSYSKAHSEFFKIREIASKYKASIYNLNPNSCVRAFEFKNFEETINNE